MLKISVAFSKRYHFHRAYLVTVFNQNFIALSVHPNKLIKGFGKPWIILTLGADFAHLGQVVLFQVLHSSMCSKACSKRPISLQFLTEPPSSSAHRVNRWRLPLPSFWRQNEKCMRFMYKPLKIQSRLTNMLELR